MQLLYLPNAVVMTLLAETSPDRCAFLLNNGSLVCYRLGSADIADELLY